MDDKKEYPVYGRWKVTTEGDCEGRTTTQLGYWEGFVDEIALHLADKSYYGLQFTLVDSQPSKLVPKRNDVHVQFAIDSGTWDYDPTTRTKKMKTLFSNRPVIIDKSNYFGSFVIRTKDSISKEDIKRAKAIDKLSKTLSEEELGLLGLKDMV
jgi:hypothetical protein